MYGSQEFLVRKIIFLEEDEDDEVNEADELDEQIFEHDDSQSLGNLDAVFNSMIL